MTNSYYGFCFDNLYNCKKVDTAVARASKDIEKLNGDSSYLAFDMDVIKSEINQNDKFEDQEIGNYMVEIEYLAETEQYYISVKYMN